MKKIYLSLAIVGAVLPYSFFIPFLVENGLDIPLLLSMLFANRISSFFATDFLLSCLIFWIFLYQETKKYRIKQWWVCMIATITIGLSCALPLFLYFRETRRDQIR
jgi:hypothetical protein